MQEYYYKATLDNKTSSYDQKFVYREGLNVHPNPSKYSHLVCGEGLHLAKTIKLARRIVRGAKEFYLARAGVILAEDDEKIRCAYIWLDKQLTPAEIAKIEKEEAMGIKQGAILTASTPPLCGRDWLDKHGLDITEADITKLRLEVKSPTHTFSLGLRMKPKDRKYLLKQAIKV